MTNEQCVWNNLIGEKRRSFLIDDRIRGLVQCGNGYENELLVVVVEKYKYYVAE